MLGKFASLKQIADGVFRVVAVMTSRNVDPLPQGCVPLPRGVVSEEALGMWVVNGRWIKNNSADEDAYAYPSLLWSGHLYDYSGYAKANREILFRLSKNVKIRVLTSGLENGPISVEHATRNRLDEFRKARVSTRAPLLRFFGPDYKGDEDRYRICWTMMETYKIHPKMVKLVNDNYHELWTPTEWNRRVFVESGVTIKTRSMPLGVDPAIYRPMPGSVLPQCKLVTTTDAGQMAVPQGFKFFTVGLPSFRKGFDIMSAAFGRAFAGREDVHLILGITHSLPEWNARVYEQVKWNKAKIWTVEGKFSEQDLARFYSACDAYVSASRGEGWNLPACEAASCGIPVIVPNNTCHAELFGEGGFLFPDEGTAEHAEANTVSPWYEGMPFSVLEEKSIEHLAEVLRVVAAGGQTVRDQTAHLQKIVRSKMTWDVANALVLKQIIAVQP
jgi:hypothetical protein